jgi:ATP-dependent Zn protease
MEWSSPESFFGSGLSKLVTVLIILEVLLQVWLARQETSYEAVVRQQTWAQRWRNFRQRFPADLRYRLRRLTMILTLLALYGQGLNLTSDRCDSAVECVMQTPNMLIEQMPLFMYIGFSVLMGMAQLGFMFYSMTKVGFVKIMMPGTMDVEFADIYGQDEAVAKMQEQVALLESDDKVKSAGGFMPNGVLLWGPPGTGKTMLAKAVANASTKPVIIVPPGGFASTFVGINFLKVWMLFRYVRKYARRYKGVIVFMDEIDSLGNRGGQVAGVLPAAPVFGCMFDSARDAEHKEAVRVHDSTGFSLRPSGFVTRIANHIIGGDFSGSNPGTLEAFLAALDGMDESRGLINRLLVSLGFPPLSPPEIKRMFIGATNLPQKVDAALLRPGRLSRKIHVKYPDHEGKVATYEGYLAKVRHNVSDEDLDRLVRNHQPATGAEVQAVVNEAVLATFRAAAGDTGMVTYEGLAEQLRVEKIGEPGDAFEDPLNRWRVAIHEAGHAVMSHHKRRQRSDIWFATIVSHGESGGMVAGAPHNDDWLRMQEDMEHDIQIALASRIAETLFFGQPSNGHAGDGRAASEMAMDMVTYGHHGNQIGHWWAGDQDGPGIGMAEDILTENLAQAHAFLAPRAAQIAEVAIRLLDEGTVEGHKIHALLDDMEGT